MIILFKRNDVEFITQTITYDAFLRTKIENRLTDRINRYENRHQYNTRVQYEAETRANVIASGLVIVRLR